MIRSSLPVAMLAGSLLAWGSIVVAQPLVSPETALAFLDADRDGKVTLNDYLNRQLPKMTAADADQNGELTYKEFKETLEGRSRDNAQQSFTAFNREGRSRTMNQREFLGYHAYVFNTLLDTSKDGALSVEELGKIMARDR